MAREKTPFKHVNSEGKKVRVTKEDDKFYIGNTNERAEGKMSMGWGNHSKSKRDNRSPHQLNNPFYGSGQGEMDDYAHTSEDL